MPTKDVKQKEVPVFIEKGYTIWNASRLLGKTVTTIRNYIEKGYITAGTYCGKTFIPLSELQKIMKR